MFLLFFLLLLLLLLFCCCCFVVVGVFWCFLFSTPPRRFAIHRTQQKACFDWLRQRVAGSVQAVTSLDEPFLREVGVNRVADANRDALRQRIEALFRYVAQELPPTFIRDLPPLPALIEFDKTLAGITLPEFSSFFTFSNSYIL